MALSREEKERILRALEEDREFRYALMGLLGYTELLERFTRLEEGQRRLEERQQRLEERFQELTQRQQRLEERQQRLEERFQKLEERFAELEKRYQKLEERFARIEERFLELEKRVLRVEEEMSETRRILTVLAHRFGIVSEAGLREALRFVVEEVLGAGRVERVVLRDDEGIVFGHPSTIEVDVSVRDDVHVLVEVKSRATRWDVAEMRRIGMLYERQRGVKPRLVIVAGFIDPEAIELAAKLGVELKPAIKEGYGVKIP